MTRTMTRPIRLTVVQTHPVQYFAPWFRHITRNNPDIALTVLYASQPTATQQATGFDTPFEWDVPLLEGYDSRVLRTPDGAEGATDFGSSSFRGVDIPEIGDAIAATKPDVVLIPGWHSITYMRALRWCRRHDIPVIWRGDSHGAGRRSLPWQLRTRALLRMFDVHLSVGLRTRAYLRRFGVPATQIFASPHHVDNDRFDLGDRRSAERAAVRARHDIPAEAFVVLWAGKLVPNKRPQDAVDAVAALGNGAVLLVVGDGPELDACRARADSLGVRMVTAGFVNQQQMPAMYAAADVLAVTSEPTRTPAGRYIEETWGLVMNEALASGIPVVANQHAGATIDLVLPAITGERYEAADVASLTTALERVRTGIGTGAFSADMCRNHIARYSFESATRGLVAACQHATRRSPAVVITLAGGLFLPTGAERSTLEVLTTLRNAGARVHLSVNDWTSPQWPDGPHLLMALAESIGATWSTAPYRSHISRSLNPVRQVRVLWDMIATCWSVARDMVRLRPTHIFVPEHVTLLRTLPMLAIARMIGIHVVLKLPNAAAEGRFYHRLWRRVINPVVTCFVANSQFTAASVIEFGVPRRKVTHIPHIVPTRNPAFVAPGRPVTRDEPPPDLASADTASTDATPRLVFMGQMIPEKGVHVLLDAVAIVLARGVDVQLDLLGDMTGWALPMHLEYRRQLREKAEQPPLAGHVHFLGFRDDIQNLLRGARAHIVPSMPEQREAFGLVVLEGKQAGLPTIVFPTGALPELIEHGVNGWICARPDAEALAEGIISILSQPDRGEAMGRAAKASLAMFDRGKYETAWLSVFSITRDRVDS